MTQLRHSVPKRSLVRPLVAALEGGRLKVAKGLAEAEALVRELQAFRRQITATCRTVGRRGGRLPR